MKLFNTLLTIQTGKISFQKSAVFIENSHFWEKWAYFIYHYDPISNTFYINDLNYTWTKNRTSAINIIEHIVTKAYRQEMNSLNDILKIIHNNKKPKIYCFYRQESGLIVMDKINLQTVRWKQWNILSFKNPIWDINDSNYVKVHKLKKNLLNLYANKPMK